MQTLSRAISAHLFRDSAQYLRLRSHWRLLLASSRRHELTASHHLLYLVLLGRDWRRSFLPIQKQRKLANGGFYQWGLIHAWHMLHNPQYAAAILAPFDGLVTADMLEQLRRWLPRLNFYQLDPLHIAREGLQCEPYMMIEDATHD